MKKLWLAVPVVLVAAWGGSSWYIGQQTEAELQRFIEQHNAVTAGSGIRQELVSYEKQFLGAKAITKLNIEMPPFGEELGDVQFINTIKNGPVLFGGSSPVQLGMSQIHTQLDMDALSAEQREVLTRLFGDTPPLEGYTVVGLGGNTSYDFTLKPLNLSEDDGKISLDKLQITGNSAADFSGDIQIQVDKFETKDSNSHFLLPSLTMEGDITGMLAGQMLGDFDFKAPNVQMDDISFDMNAQTSSREQGGAVEGKLAAQVENIQGAADMLSKLDYQLEFAGLDLKGLEELNRLQIELENIQSQIDWNMEEMETPEGQQQFQSLMERINSKTEEMVEVAFAKVLKKDQSRVRNVLHVENAQGKLDADIDLTYTGEGTPDLMTIASFGPNDWGQMFKGQVKLEADKAILPMGMDMMVAPYVEQGLLTEVQEKLAANLQLQGDKVELNGKAMSFEEFLAMFGMGMSGGMLDGAQGDMPDPAADLGIPDDLMEQINSEGLTPEVMQILEESDDVPTETIEMLKQLQQMQQEMAAPSSPPSGE